jgi:3-oxoacyl-[acyl-carrier-protein] synthase-3
MPSAYIRGIGKYLPERILASGALEKKLGLDPGWIESKTGVGERRIAAEDEFPSTMAARAAEAILADAALPPEDIEMIIVATSMPDMFFPSTAGMVQTKLGLKDIPAFDLLNACAGFLYGVAAASAFIEAGRYGNILVIGAEVMSRMLDWNDYKTCILFGDAAAGVLVSSEGKHRILGFHLGADGEKGRVLALRGGGSRYPCSAVTLENKLHTLHMDGGEVFRFAMVRLGEAVKAAAEKAGCALEKISLILPHQSNARIVEEAAKILALPMDRFFLNLNNRGNTAAASVPLALCEAAESGKLQPGGLAALASYGAGLAWASCIVEW